MSLIQCELQPITWRKSELNDLPFDVFFINIAPTGDDWRSIEIGQKRQNTLAQGALLPDGVAAVNSNHYNLYMYNRKSHLTP